MAHFTRFIIIALILMSPTLTVAGPAEDANAAIDRWSAAYLSNDPETIAKSYCAGCDSPRNCQSRYVRGNSSDHHLFHADKRNWQ